MGIDRKLLELMHADIDGRLSDGEKAVLARRLAGDPGAAAMHEGLKQLSRELSNQPQEPVPPTLKPSVLRAVEQREAAAARKPASLVFRLPLGPPLASWRPAYAFAFGAVAGVALMLAAIFIYSSAAVDHTGVTGTMVRTMEKPVFSRVAEVEFAAGGTRGVITTERSGAFRVVTVRLSAEEGWYVVAALTFGDGSVRLSGVRPAEGQIDDVQVLDDAVSVRATGKATFEVLLLADESSHRPATFTLSRDGHELYRAEVPLLSDAR